MSVIDYTMKNFILSGWVSPQQPEPSSLAKWLPNLLWIDRLQPLRNWLNHQEISDRRLAHRLCRLIPAQCPFEREIKCFGRVIISIPPLCKLNPLYDELMGLRFRALCYLVEQGEEDISQYC